MIDDKLREWHLAQLKTRCAADLYERLCRACENRPGGIRDCDQDLIFDACTTEDIKEQLRMDIKDRGVIALTINGGQRFAKENKSVALLRGYLDSQRKIYSDLRITPAKRGEDAMGEDDFDQL